MSEYEIAYIYKTAKCPGKQIQILAELNATTASKIKGILLRRGQTLPEEPEGRIVNSKISAEEQEKRLRAYAEGLTDAELAKRLGLTTTGVAHWRHTNKLPVHKAPQGRPVNKATPEEIEKRLELYSRGCTDREIAIRLGRDPKTISVWRCRRGLEPNKKEDKNDLV